MLEMVFFRHQQAQGLVEFGFIIALVAVVSIGSLLVFGSTVSGMMSSLGQSVVVNV